MRNNVSFLKSVFSDRIEFQPDYRDTILYNGEIEFRATGKFEGNLLECSEKNNPSRKILFNTNLEKQSYIKNHENFDLVRNRDGFGFSTFEIQNPQGSFRPTGRIFRNQAGLGIIWEYMRINDPQTVIFMNLTLNDNFITGPNCFNHHVENDSERVIFSNSKFDLNNFKFISSDHVRYENGIDNYGYQKGAHRGIGILKHQSEEDAYNVTMYNMDGSHRVWGTNIQMHPKQMKMISKTESKIELRGFGNNPFGVPFSDYGITLHIINNDVDRVVLHMYKKKVDIEYFK